MKHEYGYAYIEHPIADGETAVFDDGSKLKVQDICHPLPDWMKKVDILFTDSPWNSGNLRSFYTKADKDDYDSLFGGSFDAFVARLFECIKEIEPRVSYLEIGKQHLADYIINMRKLYKHVTFFNSSYYHEQNNHCYVVMGSHKRIPALRLDGMDEEDIITWVAENAPECAVIGDLCMGRGLVAVAAYKTGHRFAGTELNGKRMSVTLKRLANLGASYTINGKEEDGGGNGKVVRETEETEAA